MREDAFGLWWTVDPKFIHGKDKAPAVAKEKGPRREKQTRQEFDPRLLPDPPDTGWTPPTDFPSLESANVICLDLETHDPELKARGPGVRRDGYILGVAIATDTGFKGYYPIAHNKGFNFERERVLSWLRVELGRPRQPKLGANILYDLDYLAEAGVWVQGPILDVQIAEPLLDENARSYALEALGKKYLGRGKLTDMLESWGDKFFGKGQTKSNLRHLPSEFVGPYAEEDVQLTLEVWQKQQPILEQEGLTELFNIECRLVPCLLYMRRQGVRVDVQRAEQMATDLDNEYREHQANLNRLAGKTVEIWAGDSVAQAFKHLDIPMQRNEAGDPVFRKGYLERLDHEFVRSLVRARKLQKLNGTFIRGHILSNVIGDHIHCQFNQLRSDDSGAVSGRFSSSDPNLQNIPIRDPDFGKLIRSLFIPEEGMQWWRSDFSQIEPRILLHYASGSVAQTIREAYAIDPAMDCYVAMMKNMPPGIDRKTTKGIYLGLSYNMGKDKLADQLGVSPTEAASLYELFHHGAPYIAGLKEKVIQRAGERGYIETLLHRRRRFPFWESRDWGVSKKEGFFTHEVALEKYGPRIKRAWTYKSLNALIQGSAADVQKKAMVDIWESGLAQAAHMCLTVHDELDGSVAQNNTITAEIKHIMENAVKMRVPVLADMDIGENWGACG